ncbi:FAD-binding domain-containing protein [Cylindrobasidium torrendii FP15055 ss-10]|uniref:FAD-binding domain-containing protein n=1 Tax=Cylindrobasidium torrendii FP15055 ss-10 TaxID=1314674 RepID=A0A0D7B0H1_9AGAR|nr:FAD-binding domain-containing protein [Cylindrobasidium torrendii FP15055 ss-10]
MGVRLSYEARPYFSLHQAQMQPACYVHPTSAADVSSILKLSDAPCEFQFAVRCGGHMPWPGSSNVDAPGFTIDMEAFNDIVYDEATERVTFGAGLRWGDVYTYLGGYNRTMRGGRTMDVGVAGFLLGGGVGFPGDSFSSATVADYEVVLSSGAIVHANESDNADLFWALKYGSTNFGIVTRITMETTLDDDVWGGVQVFAMDSPGADAVLDELVELSSKLEDGMKEWLCVLMSNEGPSAIALRVAHADVPLPTIANPIVNNLNNTPGLKKSDVWKAWAAQDGVMKGEYHKWMTLTLKPDARFVRRIFDKGMELYSGKAGTWNIGFQPLPGHLFADGQPILLALFVFDSYSPDNHMRDLVDWVSTHTEMVKPFIYMNYASGDQDAYKGMDLQRYWDVKEKYDPENLLGKHWSGGFKLPHFIQHDEL